MARTPKSEDTAPAEAPGLTLESNNTPPGLQIEDNTTPAAPAVAPVQVETVELGGGLVQENYA